MLRERMQYLVDRYFKGTCTAEEKSELARWISEANDDRALQQILAQTWEQYQPVVQMPDDMSDRIQASFAARQKDTARVRTLAHRGWIAAASILLLLAAAALLWQQRSTPPVAPITVRYKNEVPAGGNKAILTLGDGTVIDLDSAANGVLTNQGRVKVVKLASGQLAYEVNGESDVVLFNTMRTPRGGQYNLTLPDGTRAYGSNAASSITYPTAFNGDTRPVSISGEAYFEVAHDADKPFTVAAGKMNVEVLGTHFNINAYADGPSVRATLLEGAVKVSSDGKNNVLQPGQQAQLSAEGALAVVNDVDVDEVTAWKSGFFQFTDADMPTVMRQLENWYDVKVSYEGDIPKRSFGGGIQRSLPLSKVLAILEENNVKFRLEERNIIVLK